MFRFSTRELVMLTAIAALTIGMLASTLTNRRTSEECRYWRGVSHALKDELATNGKKVQFVPPNVVRIGRKWVIGRTYPDDSN